MRSNQIKPTPLSANWFFETEQLIEPACYELPDAVTAVGKRIGHTLLDFQLKVVEASLSRKDLVLAAGCGSGKTTLAIASAGAMSKGVIVLYTPTVSLKHSMEVTCESLGVPYLSYSRGDRGFPSANNWDDNARVVIVVYDTGLTEEFLFWLWTLNENRLLNRIVFDEAHSLVDQANSRNVMLRMGSIASHIQNVPFSFHSGTFPQCIINYCKRVFKCEATCVEVVQPINLRHWDGVFVEEVNCPLCHNELGTVAAAKIVNELRNLQSSGLLYSCMHWN
jgi:superfamily II DNA helicase RecQ